MLDETMAYSCAIFPRAGCDARGRLRSEVRRGVPQARPQAGRSRARNRHRLGRLRDPRRSAVRLPRDHDHDLAGAARLRRKQDRGARPLGPHHGAARGLPRPRRASTTSWCPSRWSKPSARSFLDGYFAHCARLLKPEGAMLLQAITIQDQYLRTGAASRWTSSSATSSRAASSRRCRRCRNRWRRPPTSRSFISKTSARTTRARCELWRERFFQQSAPRSASSGYSDSFVRLWEYYLCYCEGGFIERQLGTVQMLLTKPGCRRALASAGCRVRKVGSAAL